MSSVLHEGTELSRKGESRTVGSSDAPRISRAVCAWTGASRDPGALSTMSTATTAAKRMAVRAARAATSFAVLKTSSAPSCGQP